MAMHSLRFFFLMDMVIDIKCPMNNTQSARILSIQCNGCFLFLFLANFIIIIIVISCSLNFFFVFFENIFSLANYQDHSTVEMESEANNNGIWPGEACAKILLLLLLYRCSGISARYIMYLT